MTPYATSIEFLDVRGKRILPLYDTYNRLNDGRRIIDPDLGISRNIRYQGFQTLLKMLSIITKAPPRFLQLAMPY